MDDVSSETCFDYEMNFKTILWFIKAICLYNNNNNSSNSTRKNDNDNDNDNDNSNNNYNTNLFKVEEVGSGPPISHVKNARRSN